MDRELLIAVIAGLGGMLGWGLADFFAKKTIDQIGDIATLVWAHLFGAIIFILIALSLLMTHRQQIVIPADLGSWALLALFGAVQAIVYLLVYRGFGKGQVALLNPVFASFSGLTAILSILFFRETVTASRIVGLIIIFIGIFLISVDVRALRTKQISFAHVPGLKEIALATILAALWTIFWDQFISGQDWRSYALLMYFFMTAVLLIYALVSRTKLSVAKTEAWKFLVLIGLCETIAYLAISLGYSETSLTSVVVLLSGAFSLPTIVLARYFLNERTTAIQTVGTLVIVLGIILLPLL